MSSPSLKSPTSSASEANSIEFFIRQFVNRIWTSTIVVVTSVSNAGNLAGAGTVSIQPLVSSLIALVKSIHLPHQFTTCHISGCRVVQMR